MCKRLLDQPWRVLVSFPNERVLKERSEVKLAVHLAITADMLLVDKSLVAGSVVETDEIAGEGVALDRAVRTSNHWEFCLFADGASRRIAVTEGDNNVLTREELALELVVNPVDCYIQWLVRV
jgi:hypothetical protein